MLYYVKLFSKEDTMSEKWLSYSGNPGKDNIESKTSFLSVNVTGYSELNTTFAIERTRVDFYIMYPVNGSFEAEINGKTEKVETGDIMLMYPGDLQRYIKRTNGHFWYYWVHFTGYAAEHILSTCGFSKSGVYKIGVNDKTLRLFKNLFSDFYGKPVESTYLEVYAAAHLMEILASMKEGLELSRKKATGTEQKIYASARYINANYAYDLSMDELASAQDMCTGYYSKMFTKYLGVPPSEYLTRLRLQNAGILLVQSNMSIAEIASSVGYSDPLYFSRIFKKHYFMSPTDYRNRNTYITTEEE